MGFWDYIKEEAKNFKNEDLKKLHTKTLLRKLQEVRVTMQQKYYDEFVPEEFRDSQWNAFIKYKKALKDILSTREHIPNKIEAKKIRQEKARRK